MEEDEEKKESVFHFIGSKVRVLPYPKKQYSIMLCYDLRARLMAMIGRHDMINVSYPTRIFHLVHQ
jgi:hypothetical protein